MARLSELIMYIYDKMSLKSSQNEQCFRQTLYKKSKHILYSKTSNFLRLFLWRDSENIILQPDKPRDNTRHANFTVDN
jgi:hypothetical protein